MIAGILALLLQAPTAAAPPSKPDFERVASPADFKRFYPRRAQRLGLGGLATLRCTANARGLMDECEVEAEDPAGMGFGEAAIQLMPYFKLRPPRDGSPEAHRVVVIPIRFQLARPPSPEPPK